MCPSADSCFPGEPGPSWILPNVLYCPFWLLLVTRTLTNVLRVLSAAWSCMGFPAQSSLTWGPTPALPAVPLASLFPQRHCGAEASLLKHTHTTHSSTQQTLARRSVSKYSVLGGGSGLQTITAHWREIPDAAFLLSLPPPSLPVRDPNTPPARSSENGTTVPHAVATR